MKRLKYIVIFLCFSIYLQGQDINRTKWWFFGNKAGLHFTDTSVNLDTNSKMNTVEGCAAISDLNGNLLFYTNGEVVWNKQHDTMDGGDSLAGHQSSVQAALIVPQPGNDSLYYIFTTYAVASYKGYQYTVVDMKANNGLGKVISPNTVIKIPTCEMLTATYHENGKDVWILTHEFGNNCFLAHLLTEKGLNNCPIKSCEGSSLGPLSGAEAQGTLKFSPDGLFMSGTVYLQNRCEVYKFNKTTGKLSSPIRIVNLIRPYSLEFSNSGKYLYINDVGKRLYQYDISSFDESVVNATQKEIFIFPTTSFTNYTLQYAPDGKIYSANYDKAFLSIINRPDSTGDSCLFVYNGISLTPKMSKGGLPNFVTSYFGHSDIDFTYKENCSNRTVQFFEKYNNLVTSIKWRIFRDSAILDSLTISNPSYTFKKEGDHIVELIINDSEVVRKRIFIEPVIFSNHGIVVCNSDSLQLIIPKNYGCINWQDGSDTDIYTVKQAGLYTVNAYNTKGCYVTDNVEIIFSTVSKPSIMRSNDTLHTDSMAYSYTWFRNGISIPGSNNDSIRITDTGIYQLQVTNINGCDTVSETLEIKCPGKMPHVTRFHIDSLETDIEAFSYKWTLDNTEIPGSNSRKIRHTGNGTYKVEITDSFNCKVVSDGFILSIGGIYQPEINCKIYPNPATQNVNIESENSQTQKEIICRNILGSELIHISSWEGKVIIDCGAFPKGIYMLEIRENDRIKTEKIIIR